MVDIRKKVITMIVTALFINIITLAQLPSANFSIPLNACSDETFEINNISTNATQYFWDFCEGDLFALPTFQNIGLIDGSFNPKAIDVVRDGDLWYGFITSQSTNSLYRVDFGMTLDNPSPLITDLGNIDGLLIGPEPIKIVSESGNWYAFIINGTNSTLLRLSYGTSLENQPAGEIVLSNISTFNSGIDIGETTTQKVLVASNFSTNEVTMVNFGNSYSNNPLPADIITTSAISGAVGSGDIKIFYDKGSWFGFLLTPNSKKIFRLDYGNNLFSIPTNTDITGSIIGTEFALGIEIARDKGEFVGLIQANSGNLIRVDFGNTINNDSPTSELLGDFGILQNNSSFKLIKDQSQWYAFTIDTPNKILFGGIFPNICSSTFDVSIIESPYGINYSDQGTKYISLIAMNNKNELSYVADSITISSSPAPQLSTQITGNCLSNPISFAGQELSGNITNWNWDFGDGSGTSAVQNDTYTYASAGTYQVKLSVTDANGCNNLYMDSVTVYEEPIPDFSFPVGTICMNNPVAFTNTTTGESGSAVSWTWDFNGEGTSTDKDPDFTFLTPGNKTITLTSSIPGCANVTQQNIFIIEAPTTLFSFDNACNGQSTIFADSTTGNNLTSWSWDFGDGNNSSDQSPMHNYALPGKYVVTLAVSNNLGCTTIKVDTVYNHAVPVISFINDLPCSTASIQFTDQSIVEDANIVSWEWDFGDGTTSTVQNPQYSYNQMGDFTVQLKAFSQFGCVDSIQSVITILQGPEVDFRWDKVCEGEATSFTDLTNSFGKPITNWTWLIDDILFTEQNPQYIFQEADTFTVQLGVTIDNLCAQTIFKDIIVETPTPTSFDYFESCVEDSTTFVDTTPAVIESWKWRINGAPKGTSSTLTTHLIPDNYSISLTTTSFNGCITNITESIDIVGSLTAQYSASTKYGAVPLNVQFSNQSTGTNSYLWQFGDDTDSTSNEINPLFEFTEIGNYEVTLIAMGGLNCGDTTSQIIEVVEPVNELIIAAISPQTDGQIVISMTNTGSITYDENNLNLIFTIDDGVEIIEPFSQILYPQSPINYPSSIILGETGNSKALCVQLEYINGGSSENLDTNCLNLNDEVVISSAFPNPTVNELNFSIILPEAGTLSILLVDRNGAVVLSSNEDGQQGLNNYIIDITPFNAGLYILKIKAGSITKEMKVVIDR